MFEMSSIAQAPKVAAVLALGLAVATAQADTEEAVSGNGGSSEAAQISVDTALKAMAGMGGYYRVAPSGDTYLYPNMKLVRDFHGMFGAYRVAPTGITLYPVGMAAPDLSMSSMGDVAGSFRVTPTGDTYFYPSQKPPIGMGGMRGPGSEWGPWGIPGAGH